MGNPSGVPHLADLLAKKSFFIRPAQTLKPLGNALFTEVHIDDYLKDINHDHEQQLKKETFAMARQQRFEPKLFEEKLRVFVANI